MHCEIAVVGAGVVGLACALELTRAGRSVVVLERHGQAGLETSSRNSEVIHAGLYYPPTSLKAQSCVRGRELLYAHCRQHGIAHRKTGKLVVATTEAQVSELQILLQRGNESGAGDLRLVDAAELHRLEPNIRGVAALLSPESGIVDSHGLVDSYRRQAVSEGAVLALHSEVLAIERQPEGFRLHCQSVNESVTLSCDRLVNAAGLQSDTVAALCGVPVDALGLRLHPCKGDYFALSPRFRHAVRHLIYPVPATAGLGIHLTLDLAGELRAGPDARYVSAPSYAVDERSRDHFAGAVSAYFPSVTSQDLTPAYAGVRPKLAGPGKPFRDFELWTADGAVHLLGIESPGLTAAGALAEQVRARLTAGI